MVSIAERVREILQEAIERVSSGGQMKFDIRSLYYAVRELFLKRWSGDKFYLYNSFTQDFMRNYEKRHGKVKDLVRGPRGMYAAPDTYGVRSQGVVRPGFYLAQGIGNKIIVVEKMGLFEQMVANNFDRRLDCIIMTTQGFTSEAGRNALLQVESWGLPVCVLHDYDINGILIKETLTKPTKRLDTSINPHILKDVGLTYSVVNDLMQSRDLTPEPVSLSKQDLAKLEGMFDRDEISDEEYDFLMNGRVELNALTPLELLQWLETRLEDLDLWKTVPGQHELDETMKDQMKSELDDTKTSLVDELRKSVEDELGLTKIWDAMWRIRNRIKNRLDAEISTHLDDIDYPKKTVEELKDEMRENMEKFWKALAKDIASELAEGLTEPFVEKVEEEQEDIIEEGVEDSKVVTAKDNLAKDAQTWLQEQGYD